MLKTAGTKSQRGDCRTQQAADHRTSERRILFAALAETKRHGNHPDNHGQCGHQHRAEPRETRFNRGLHGVAVKASRSFAKATTRMLLAVATPMHMMDPIKAGTLSVVRVTNRNRTIPASAAGKSRDNDEGIQPGLKVHHDQQVDQDDRKGEAGQQTGIRGPHGVQLAADGDETAARKRLSIGFDDPRDIPPAPPRSRSCTAP